MFARASFVLALAAATAQAEVVLRADPRIELLTTVQLLSGSERLNTLQQAYRTNLQAYFAPYRDHAAVRLAGEMDRAGFVWDAPLTLMLHLSDPPELAVRVPYSQYLIQRAGGQARLDAFVAALRDFARVSRFSDFYEANCGVWDTMARAAQARLEGVDYVGKLEAYHGVRKASHTVILSPFLWPGGVGPAVGDDIFAIIGPVGVSGGIADFGTAARLQDILWHEFGHSYANPLVEAEAAYVNRFTLLFEPVAEQMRASSYNNWQTSMYEHLVRAVHVRLACRELAAEACDARYRYDRTVGFAYLDTLLERLKEYEAARDRYPTLRDFGQRLFSGLEAEQTALQTLLADTSGRVAIRATRPTVKVMLFLLIRQAGGTLLRESADEASYSGMGMTGTFKFEVRDGQTITSIEPNVVEARQLLVVLKFRAEADPDPKNIMGMTTTPEPDGKLRAIYIREASRAEAMGFKIGDVLVDWATMARAPLTAAEIQRLKDLPDEATATVRIVRNGEPTELTVAGRMR